MVGEKSESDEDPNLRSANEIVTYEVKTSDGELGSMNDLVVEDANWFIRFLVLSAGSGLQSETLLVATRWVRSLIWRTKKYLCPIPATSSEA
jgi:hypothetical protein